MPDEIYKNIFNPVAEKKSPRSVKDVLYSFLSGLNKKKIGGNTSVLTLEYDDGSAFRCMVDPGDIFGDNRNLEHPGVKDCDTIIADMTDYFEHERDGKRRKAKKPLDMIILSHSHRDHIGAVSKMILMGCKMPPIYATPYTKQRLYQHLNNENIDPKDWPKVIEIAPGGQIKRDGVDIGFFSVSHSTPQSLGLAFKTVEGTIVHTCDWKADKSLIWGPGFNEAQFKKVAGEDISLLLMDSTGADSAKRPVTEKHFRNTLRMFFEKHKNKRFIIASHPGFEENMASIAKVLTEYEKTLFVDSWSHEQVFSALDQTGLKLSDHIGKDVDMRSLTSAKNQRDIQNMQPKNVAVLVAGVMGQKNASLNRAVMGRSKTLKLDPKTDVILMCGPNMPGQDKVNKFILMAEMKSKGFQVYGHPDYKLYPHAHARQAEIKYMADLAQAKTIIPVHGCADLRGANKILLEKQNQKVLIVENGQTVRLKGGKTKLAQDLTVIPEYIGFETRSGSHWTDRDYIVKKTVNYNPDDTCANDDNGARGSQKRRPRLFDGHKRYSGR